MTDMADNPSLEDRNKSDKWGLPDKIRFKSKQRGKYQTKRF